MKILYITIYSGKIALKLALNKWNNRRNRVGTKPCWSKNPKQLLNGTYTYLFFQCTRWIRLETFSIYNYYLVSITRSAAVLSLMGLFLIVIGLLSTFIFYIFNWHLSPSICFFILLSISSLVLDSFFCYELCCSFMYSCSILLFILSDGCWSIACNECCDWIASYLEERRNELLSTTVTIVSIDCS